MVDHDHTNDDEPCETAELRTLRLFCGYLRTQIRTHGDTVLLAFVVGVLLGTIAGVVSVVGVLWWVGQ